MLKKIKYLIDNITQKDDEEKVLSRRSFLFTLPALIAVPKLIEPAIKYKIRQPGMSTIIEVTSAKIGNLELGPGLLEIKHYQKEIFDLAQRRFVFGEKRSKLIDVRGDYLK